MVSSQCDARRAHGRYHGPAEVSYLSSRSRLMVRFHESCSHKIKICLVTRHQEDRRNPGCLEQAPRGKEEKFILPNVERDISMPFHLNM